MTGSEFKDYIRTHGYAALFKHPYVLHVETYVDAAAILYEALNTNEYQLSIKLRSFKFPFHTNPNGSFAKKVQQQREKLKKNGAVSEEESERYVLGQYYLEHKNDFMGTPIDYETPIYTENRRPHKYRIDLMTELESSWRIIECKNASESNRHNITSCILQIYEYFIILGRNDLVPTLLLFENTTPANQYLIACKERNAVLELLHHDSLENLDIIIMETQNESIKSHLLGKSTRDYQISTISNLHKRV